MAFGGQQHLALWDSGEWDKVRTGCWQGPDQGLAAPVKSMDLPSVDQKP